MPLILTAELVYQHYLSTVHYNEDEYEEKRDKPIHRASNGGRCHKLQAYHVATEEQEVLGDDGSIGTKQVKKYKPKALNESDMAVFRIGNVFHEEIQEAFRWLIDTKHKDNPNIEFDMEQKIKVDMYGLLVEGHYDLKILDHKNKIVQVLDLKTMNPRAMTFFKKDPYSKTGYIIQLGTYAIGIKKQHPEYELVLLLSAWDKDKGSFHEVEIDVNRAIIAADTYYKNLAETMKLDVDDIIPLQHPFAPMEPAWECNYCQYNHICNSPKIKRI